MFTQELDAMREKHDSIERGAALLGGSGGVCRRALETKLAGVQLASPVQVLAAASFIRVRDHHSKCLALAPTITLGTQSVRL